MGKILNVSNKVLSKNTILKTGGMVKIHDVDSNNHSLNTIPSGLAGVVKGNQPNQSISLPSNKVSKVITSYPDIQYGGSIHTKLNRINFNKKSKKEPENIKFTI